MKDFLNLGAFNEKKPIWLHFFKGYTLIGSALIFVIANILAIVTAAFSGNAIIWFAIFFAGSLLTVINFSFGMIILHFGHHIATISACSKRSLAIQLAEYNHKYKDNNADEAITNMDEGSNADEAIPDIGDDTLGAVDTDETSSKDTHEKAFSHKFKKQADVPAEKIKVDDDINNLISADDFD